MANLYRHAYAACAAQGDNTVMMQQVARGLLEDKAMLAAGPPSPAGLDVRPGGASLPQLSALLAFREKALAFRVGSAMAGAARAASGGKAGAERAAAASFDAQLDVVIALGWANVERYALDTFAAFAARQAASLAAPLQLLATLYGLNCVSRDAATLLAAGALSGGGLEVHGEVPMRVCRGALSPRPLYHVMITL